LVVLVISGNSISDFGIDPCSFGDIQAAINMRQFFVFQMRTVLKSIIFASILLCLALTARAQQTQQADSIITSPWMQVHTPGSFVTLGYISSDTCWGYGDTSALLSSDGGYTWYPHGGYVYRMRNAHEGYGLYGAWIFKTYNAWQTWDTVSDPLTSFGGVFDIVDSLHVFLGGGVSSNELERSTDGGKTWAHSFLGVFDAMGMADDLVGYAVGPVQQGPKQGDQGVGAFKTTDGGGSWVQHYPGDSIVGIYDAYDVAVVNENTAVMVGDNELIARTTDGGNTWRQIPPPDARGNIFEGIAIKGAIGYISGDYGLILRTTDTGNSWTVDANYIRPGAEVGKPFMYGDSLAAITADSGIILIRNGSLASVPPPQTDSLSIVVFPNPSQSLVMLSYSLHTSQVVTLTLFDLNGNPVSTPLNSAQQGMGNQSIPISIANLSSGTYFYRFSSQNYSASGSFIVAQ
jgi:hypothetical protein